MASPRVLWTVIVAIAAAGCGDSVTSPSRALPNLLPNGSFEIHGRPTLEGWRAGNPAAAQLIREAPVNGGAWSLELVADWAPTTAYVVTSVPSVRDGDVVRLTARVRAYGPMGGGGLIGLVVAPTAPGGLGAADSTASTTDTLWTELTVERTLAMAPGDSLWVVLSSFHTEIVAFQGLFDSVTLTRSRR
jgi:hypothetical protein